MAESPLGALSDSAGWSAAPVDSAEARALLQRRLALYTGMTALVSGGHLALTTLTHAAIGGGARWGWYVGGWGPRVHLVIVLLGVAIWAICQVGSRSARWLLALDMLYAIGQGAGYAFLNYAFVEATGQVNAQGLLAIGVVMLTRAAMVPVDVRCTVGTTLLAVLPSVVSTYLLVLDPQAAGQAAWLWVANAMTWSGTITVASGMVSHATFRLRERVREVASLGQYTLGEKIGAGGMGTVYRAHHALLRRPTAVKLLQTSSASPDDLRRFEREVQVTAGLTHPNTVAIYDYGHSRDGVFYYAMEYIEGLTLGQVVEHDGPQSPARVIHVLRQVCGALGEAHAVGLVHRDIKPDNILLCERGGVPDVVKVVDFGLVKDLSEAATTSRTDAIAGTPMYLSPEAIRRPDDVGPRSDLYALGAVAYFLLTGRHVFEGGTILEVCSHHLTTPPAPPSEVLGRALPVELEDLVLRCLDKDPARRPQTAAALDEALAACEQSHAWQRPEAHAWWQRHRETPRPVTDPSPNASTVLALDLGREVRSPVVRTPTMTEVA